MQARGAARARARRVLRHRPRQGLVRLEDRARHAGRRLSRRTPFHPTSTRSASTGPAYDQVTTMSKFLAWACGLPTSIAASTVNAAQALGRPELGSCDPEASATRRMLLCARGISSPRTCSARSSRASAHLAKGAVIGGKMWHRSARTMAFRKLPVYANCIAGRWSRRRRRCRHATPRPARRSACCRKASRETARRAIAAAKRAQPGWAADRCSSVPGCASRSPPASMRGRAEIARTLSEEQGKPLAEAIGEVTKAADGFRLAAELFARWAAKRCRRRTRRGSS